MTSSLRVVATTYVLERFVERWPDLAEVAEAQIALDVREAREAGRVACRLPRALLVRAGRRPRPRIRGGRFVWTADAGRGRGRVYVVKRAAGRRAGGRYLLVWSVFKPREVRAWEEAPGGELAIDGRVQYEAAAFSPRTTQRWKEAPQWR